MFELLIQFGIIIIILVAAWQLSALLPAPMGKVFQIILFAVAGIWLLMLLGQVVGVGPGVPRLR